MPPVLDYDILRKGETIGHQHIAFRTDGDRILMHSEIKIEVRLLFVTAFRYEQVRDEVWRGDKMLSLTAVTNDDGKKCDLRVQAEPAGFVAMSGKESWTLPADAVPLSYWHISMVTGAGPLFDTACGKLLSFRAQKVGPEAVTARRAQVETIHYKIDDPGRMRDMWYDSNRILVQTSVVGRDGSSAVWVLK